jgi:hypothetical protein
MISPHIYRTNVDPTLAPVEAGIHWINTLTGIAFFSVGTSSVLDWTTSVGISDHTLLSNIGTNLHSSIDSFIANAPVSATQASAIALKENTITATTSADYYRGDKTFQTLNKSAVGLPNVTNTDCTVASNITQDSTHRFATDAEKTLWNAGGGISRGKVLSAINMTQFI